jgi:branched-chain amino acid transport system ATP-binding protein
MTAAANTPVRPVLSVQGLGVSYGKVNAVTEVSLAVGEGQIVSIIGPNGAGKSTSLMALMGVLPCKGRVLLGGAELLNVSIEERVARGMVLVPEKRALFATMSVEDNLLMGSYRQYRSGNARFRDDMDEVFRRFPRLLDRRRQLAGTLSGGERAMLVIGRALMARPTLLMLDEPSLGLAPMMVRTIFDIISDLRSTGVAILLVEQNARSALRVSDHSYVLENGTIAHQGSSDELASDERVVASYLGGSTLAAAKVGATAT